MTKLKRIVTAIAALFLIAPVQAFADGTAMEENNGLTSGTYLLIIFMILLLVFVTAYILQKNRLGEPKNVKRAEERARQQRIGSRVRLLKWGWILSLTGLVLTVGINVFSSQHRDGQVSMDHIHGIGYSQDGGHLLFASHDGLKVLSEGTWSAGPGGKHDFMGFTAVDSGFYSSGHPAPGSSLKEPFGLVRSTDEGKTLEPLAYYGKIDFHMMTAGYRSHTLYVYNPQPQPDLKETGLYVSKDEGKTWSKSDAKGVTGEWTVLAAHPDDPSIIAAGTGNGLYLSRDYGKTFEGLLGGKQITSLAFSPKGILYAGTYGPNPGLAEINIAGKETKELTIPQWTKDAVAYIAVHPQNENELAIATFQRQAYTSSDRGNSWNQIVFSGKSKP